MTDFENLSESELQTVLESVEKVLKSKQANKRKDVIAKIRELAASINVTVEIHENDKKSVRKGITCLLYTSPSPRDGLLSRMPSSAWKK